MSLTICQVDTSLAVMTLMSTRSVEVRRVTDAEVPAWVDACNTGFYRHGVDGEVEARRQGLDLDRTWGAFDGDRIVGTLRSFATELTVPGNQAVPAAALTNVTVTTTHRRMGLLTRMLTADLAAAAERGEAVGILIASEYPIYGRYGYGPAAEEVTYTVDARHARLALPDTWRDPIQVELADPKAARDEAAAVYERYRAQQPGAIGRNGLWWDRTAGLAPSPRPHDDQRAFWALARDQTGVVTGYVIYRVESVWEERLQSRSVLEVHDLIAADPQASARLWRHCLEADLVTTVRAFRGPDDLLPWLLADARDVRQSARTDHLWVRMLDVPRALATRHYLTSGRVVLRVTDPLGYADGVFLLEGGPEGASCAPTREAAELTLPVEALGSVYLGGVSLALLAAAGRVDEHRQGVVATTDAMLRSPVMPWCATWF
jgi:predicted acetyltransferase